MDDQPRRTPSESGLPLAEAERTYSYLFDVSPFPAVVSRLDDHTVLAVNARWSEVIGLSHAQALGVSVSDYYVDPVQRMRLVEQVHRDGRADNLQLQVTRANGQPFWVLASCRLITWRGEPAVLTVFHDITAQIEAEASLTASERRLATQSDALTALTARYSESTDRFEERLRSILEMSALALKVERLSMWRFEHARSIIRCAGLYCRTERRYDSGAVIQRPDAPAYFEALDGERVIAAADARTDPRTVEFLAGYLIPNSIGAMLDVPLRHDNVTVGVLCAEHVGDHRQGAGRHDRPAGVPRRAHERHASLPRHGRGPGGQSARRTGGAASIGA